MKTLPIIALTTFCLSPGMALAHLADSCTGKLPSQCMLDIEKGMPVIADVPHPETTIRPLLLLAGEDAR